MIVKKNIYILSLKFKLTNNFFKKKRDKSSLKIQPTLHGRLIHKQLINVENFIAEKHSYCDHQKVVKNNILVKTTCSQAKNPTLFLTTRNFGRKF